jgi:hypothetical protein
MTASADKISSSREVLLASAPAPGVDPIPEMRVGYRFHKRKIKITERSFGTF